MLSAQAKSPEGGQFEELKPLLIRLGLLDTNPEQYIFCGELVFSKTVEQRTKSTRSSSLMVMLSEIEEFRLRLFLAPFAPSLCFVYPRYLMYSRL